MKRRLPMQDGNDPASGAFYDALVCKIIACGRNFAGCNIAFIRFFYHVFLPETEFDINIRSTPA